MDGAAQQSDEPDKVRATNGLPRPLQVIRVLCGPEVCGAMLTLALGLGVAAALADSVDVTVATSMGKISGRAAESRPRDPFSLQLEFRDESRGLLLRIPLSVDGPYGIYLWPLDMEGLPQGSFAAVSAWMAADRLVAEPFLLGVVDGKLSRLLPKLPGLSHQEAACLYPSVQGRPPLLTTLIATAGRCVVCWPKQYLVARYQYDGARFRKLWQFTSSGAFDDPDAAVKHYGVPCTVDLVHPGKDHMVKMGPPQ